MYERTSFYVLDPYVELIKIYKDVGTMTVV